ncbi:MAG: DUF898 family protein [Chitinophagales bacterium]|nr:DUF898 family protein [Chitinophagales bacterium]
MKNYFNFSLSGEKLFPYWLIFNIGLVFVYGYGMYSMFTFFSSITPGEMRSPEELQALLGDSDIRFYMNILSFVLLFAGLVFYFYFFKFSVEATSYKEENFAFSGQSSEYFGKIVLGFFLTIITLGIYFPWFSKTLVDYFAQNTRYKEHNFRFNSTGTDLFLKVLLYYGLPLFGIVILNLTLTSLVGIGSIFLFLIAILCAIVVLYFYLIKWLFNYTYKNYNIQFDGKLGSFFPFFFVQLLLSYITLGIYMPLAYLKIYQFVLQHTEAKSADKVVSFGYDSATGDDFLYLWGQILLTLITLGLYYPWAICNIYNRVLGKTYTLTSETDNKIIYSEA